MAVSIQPASESKAKESILDYKVQLSLDARRIRASERLNTTMKKNLQNNWLDKNIFSVNSRPNDRLAV